MVECSNGGCKWQLSVDCRFKTCDHCRAYKKKWRTKPENTQKARDYENSAKGHAKRKRYLDKPKGQQMMQLARARYYASENGKQKLKDSNAVKGALLINKLATKMCLMVKGSRTSSKTVNVHTVWESSDSIKEHLESTFDRSWITWDNYGLHRIGEPRRWQIGHRIPRSAYNSNIEEDVINCWKPENIFAQDAFENIQLGNQLPDDVVLERLRPIWPKGWTMLED